MSLLNVFMYHRVRPEAASDAVSVEMLRRQLRYLRNHYHVLTCGELINYLDGNFTSRRPCAAVTFDDGWYDNYLYATPVLRECGVQGIVALSSGFIHDRIPRTDPQKDAAVPLDEACRNALYNDDRSAFLTGGEVRDMAASGVWCFQGHGTEHRRHFRSLQPHRACYPDCDDFSLPYALEGREPYAGLPVGNLVSSLAWPRTSVPDAAFGGGGQGVFLLAQENREQYRERVRKGLERNIHDIEHFTGRRPVLLFWPWGQYSQDGLEIARELEFRYTFSVEKGYIRKGTDQLVLPRIGVSEKWSKFVRNSRVFRHPVGARVRSMITPTRPGLQKINWGEGVDS